VTRPTDPQDPTSTNSAAADQRATHDAEERPGGQPSDGRISGVDNGHGGATRGGVPTGSADPSEAAPAEPNGSGAGPGSRADPGSGAEPRSRTEDVGEDVGEAPTQAIPAPHPATIEDRPATGTTGTAATTATEAIETGRGVGGSAAAAESPAAALPPPWERATTAADDTGTAPESTRGPAGSSERAPGPSSRRPRGRRSGRTDQTDLGTARTVALDPGRPDPSRPDDSRADPGQAATTRADGGRPDMSRVDAPPRPPGRGDSPPMPPGRGSELGRFGLGRPGADPGGEQDGERSGPGRPGGFGTGWPRNRRPRQAALQLKRLDPWSVLKIALVLAVVLYLVWLVAVGVLYGVLDGIGVWDRLNGQYADLVTEQTGDQLISAGRVFGVAAVIGAVNSLLFAVALSVGAFIYNVSADLVGGVEVTLSERD
jgi:hypothetical protein